MTKYPDDIPLKPRRFPVVSSSPEEPVDDPSEPIVLALLVVEVLREAKLVNAVLKMRAPPAGWLSFLVELDSVLREDSRDISQSYASGTCLSR